MLRDGGVLKSAIAQVMSITNTALENCRTNAESAFSRNKRALVKQSPLQKNRRALLTQTKRDNIVAEPPA